MTVDRPEQFVWEEWRSYGCLAIHAQLRKQTGCLHWPARSEGGQCFLLHYSMPIWQTDRNG